MSLVRTTMAIDDNLLARFDEWMAKRSYVNRSEAVRDLIRSALSQQEWAEDDAEVVATLSIVFDHAERSLGQELTRLQHDEHHAILCSQHIHLNHDDCLEVIVMSGPAGTLRRLAESIIATRGVRAGEISILSRNI